MDADTAATPAGRTGPDPATWPRIADYWPDPDAAPARPHRQPPALPTSAPPPGRRWAKPVIGTVVALLLIAGAAITGHRLLARPTAAPPSPITPLVPVATPPGTDPAVGPATVLPEPSPSTSASTSARPKAPPPSSAGAAVKAVPPPAAASFELASDLTEISISTARLASGIARAGASGGSSAVPELAVSGATAKLTVTAQGDQAAKVAVVLDERIVWTVRIGGGSRLTRIDLSGAGVARIDLVGGAREIDLALPRLRSALPVRMSGGVHTWRITTAGRVPVRLIARDGAGGVDLYGDDRGGLGRGERTGSSGSADGELDLDAVGGLGSLTVAER